MIKDTGWVVNVIQVGSAALKPAWRNHSAMELEATCLVWTLETGSSKDGRGIPVGGSDNK